jgi:biopolymer transport protein ExbD
MRIPCSLRHGEVGCDMTPLVDVVFLLIIFFLVSSHLAKQESQLPLPLPAADSGSEAIDDQTPRVIVNVKEDGTILLAGTPVSQPDLERRLAFEADQHASNTSAGKTDLEVRIRSARSVPYRRVEPIMLAAARAGIWNVTFAVYRREDVN